jgi:hypothetical protein
MPTLQVGFIVKRDQRRPSNVSAENGVVEWSSL